jgi:hypothetical protein
MPEIRVDEQLNRLLKNPAQLAALVFLLDGPASKSDVAKELGVPVKKADYDVRQLDRMGLVEPVGTELRRGIQTTIFRAVMRPIWSNAEWAELSQDERERYVLWTYQLVLRDTVTAWYAKTFQARVESHSSRSPLRVDEQGWIRLNEILDTALKDASEVEVESVERARLANDESKLLNVRAAMFCFEMPSKGDLPQ